MSEAMKIDMSGAQPMVDARDLGALLDLPAQDIRALMRAGEITSRFETGEDENGGKVRLTFFHNRRRAGPTCAEDGTVLTTTRVIME